MLTRPLVSLGSPAESATPLLISISAEVLRGRPVPPQRQLVIDDCAILGPPYYIHYEHEGAKIAVTH
jgi:hypothetical protein